MPEISIERWLPLVAKPSRYIDHELNASRKAWQETNFCLVYPDVYEVGISHLGLKILYSILNSLPGVMADRCYLPWLDLADIMRREHIPLFGLESRRPMRDFDLIGITLQSELTFSNILELLDLGGLPVLAAERGEEHPLVMAGGPCATNPWPLTPFIDVFFLGEAEEAIREIADILSQHQTKARRLRALAELEGCFVPALQQDQIKDGWRLKVHKYSAFDSGREMHAPQLLPWQLATHNRCVAEIMRGCSRGCRFCHAGYFYRPVRERPAESILAELLGEIRSSGWDEAGLLSLSSSDYSCLPELLTALAAAVDTDKTHISLPSLRVDSLDEQTVELMRRLGREGLTIAPEAGTQRLRDVINKNLTREQILAGVRVALRLGWQKLKLYFMLGLPTETEADCLGIIDLIEEIAACGGKRLQVNVTLSPFVPKPGTPFQWAPMPDAEELLRRILLIKHHFGRSRQVRIKYHTIETSVLEAVFSRGDQRVGASLHKAWLMGARFDGWNECFDFAVWSRAFAETGLDYREFLAARDPAGPLPWDFIDTGVGKAFLLQEWDKAQRGEATPDCRASCVQCGVCGPELQTVTAPRPSFDADQAPLIKKPLSSDSHPAQYRYRISYAKTGLLRFIAHLDWMRMLFRLIGKAPLETVFTQGFSPHPKASLCPPLPLGVESNCEYCDLSFRRRYEEREIIARMSGGIPEFEVLSAQELPGKGIQPRGEELRLWLPPDLRGQAESELEAFQASSSRVFTKSTATRSRDYDLKEIVINARWQEDQLVLVKSLASPALYDVLSELLRLDKTALYSFHIRRSGWIF